MTNTQEVQSLRLGQHIVLEGVFSHFDAATNHGEFDVRAYSAGKGIGGRVRKAQVLAAEEDYSFLREKLFAFRRRLHDRLAKVFPEKEASVMQTLLLGEKEEMDAEVKALYQRNGIAHILSISGLHITLLGMGCYRLLKRLGAPVRVAAAGGAMTLLLYGMMVGMSVSASRAIGMYLLQMLGIFVGRTYDMLTGVGLLAALLVLQQPERLGDVSFLMSFGAVLGICLLTPVFAGDGREDNVGVETASGVVAGLEEKKRADGKRGLGEALGFAEKKRTDGKSGFGERSDFDTEQRRLGNGGNGFRVPAWLLTVTDILGDSAYERNKYREGWRKVVYERLWRMVSALKSGFAASAGVILFTLPIQLWFFYEIPVYSVLLNLLVLPFMSVVMAGGILSLIPGLGIAGTVDCLILWWYEWICERFGELPGAVWCVGRPAKWQMVVYYSGLFVLIIGRNYAEKWKRQRLYAAYVAENNHGDGHRTERERQRRETRRVDDSGRGRKRESNRKKMQHSDRYSEICPTRWRHVLANFWYTWQGVMTYRNGVMCRIVAAMILVLIVGLLTGNFDRGSRVTFLDVGQGDGIVVETGQGAYLFDCGSTSRRKIGEYVLKPYLKSRGIQSLRGVFVSHPDEDHMNGILELLENGGEWGITVEQMFLPAITEAERREAFEKLLVAAEYAGVPVSYIKCGDEIRDSRLRLRCLHGDLLPLAGHVLDLLPRRFGRRLLRRCLHIGSRQVPVAQTGFGRPEIDQQPFAGKQLVPPHIERHEQESRRDRQRIKQSCEARPTTRVRFIVIRIVIIHRSILTRKTPQGGIPRVSLYSGEVAAMSVKLLALAMRIMATTSSKATDLSQCSETVGFSCPASRDLRAFSTPSREPTFSVST